MITKINIKATQNGKELVDLALKSTDAKPTTGIMNGSFCMEVDTGSIYAYDEDSSEWAEIGSSGGGGGGGGSSDFSTAEVTFINSNPQLLTDVPVAFVGLFYDYLGWIPSAENGATYTVVLYKNSGDLSMNYDAVPTQSITEYSATGGVHIDVENEMITVDGDGTLTYTPS